MTASLCNHFPTEELVPGTGFHIRKVPLSYFLHRLETRRAFSYTKINHGFWDRMLDLARHPYDSSPEGRREADERRARDFFLEGGFLDELRPLLKSQPTSDDDLFMAVSHLAFPRSDRVHGETSDPIQVVKLMREMLPAQLIPLDGLFWKQIILEGEIGKFIDAIRSYQIVVVGPDELAELRTRWDLPRFRQETIHRTQARALRYQTLDNIQRQHQQYNQEPVIYLFQAGTLATWFVLKLHRQMPNAFLLDLGNALNIGTPEVLARQNWARCHRELLWEKYGVADAEWARRRDLLKPAPVSATVSTNPEPIRFVEDKPIDLDFVGTVLQESAAARQWSNFGPVAKRLEEIIAAYLKLPPDRKVVLCCNGTVALFALVHLHEYLAGRPLRWVVSAFGFHCSHQGPLAQAKVVDCNRFAMLDLNELVKVPLSSYDGVVITNVFGLTIDIQPYVDFCKQHHKVLLCDAAAAFDADFRLPLVGKAAIPDEIISFHHTKPWGMGEGGCAIVSAEHEDAFRSLINFGIYRSINTGAQSTNGKLSDLAAAFIIQRLRDLNSLRDLYIGQYKRIERVGTDLGYKMLTPGLAKSNRQATPVCMPLLAPGPVPLEKLQNDAVVLRKYYAPLAANCPMARNLYDRIVNVPCHPGLAALPTEAIARILENILAVAEPPVKVVADAQPNIVQRLRHWFKPAA